MSLGRGVIDDLIQTNGFLSSQLARQGVFHQMSIKGADETVFLFHESRLEIQGIGKLMFFEQLARRINGQTILVFILSSDQ